MAEPTRERGGGKVMRGWDLEADWHEVQEAEGLEGLEVVEACLGVHLHLLPHLALPPPPHTPPQHARARTHRKRARGLAGDARGAEQAALNHARNM